VLQEVPDGEFFHRYGKYTTDEENKNREKSNDRFMDAYTEMVDRVNELSLVSLSSVQNS
jgi:hypothetical protein